MKYRRTIARLSPLWLGIGLSALLIAILLLFETVLGRWDVFRAEGEFDPLARVSSGVLRDLRLAVVHCLVIGYLPAAILHVLRSGRRTVLVLQDALNCTREECEALAASLRLGTRGLVITGLIAFALSIGSPYLVPPVPTNPWSPSSWNAEVAWHRILNPATMIGSLWLGYAIVTVSVRMSRIASKLSRINLLDLSSLAPFTRQGHTNALLLIGLLSIWSLMMLETGFGQVMLLIGVAMVVGSVLAMWFPVRGVHKRIRQSKDAELDWLNDEILKQRSALQSPDAERRSGEMADLVAYRSLIGNVPEWPFTTSTYTRLVLYALIPVASWGIGIVAEEIVGRALSL